MFMRNFSTFNEAKEIYIERVLYHIHYKKLGKRIKEEIENHMDDMYDDFKNDFDNELNVAKKVIDEMGDPDELGLELKNTHKTTLRIVRFFKVSLTVFVILLPILCQTVWYDFFDDIRTYYHATDIETKEMQIIENYNNGEPIHLLAEIEYDGIVYRYYLPDEKPENGFVFFKTQSIKVHGKSVKDKFMEYGRTSGPDENEMMLNLGNSPFNDDHLWVLYGETGPKYVKRYYEPKEENSGLEPYWSDFIEIPQNGTYENPVIIFSQSPEGYRWNYLQTYDENKEKYVYSQEEKDKQSYYSTEVTE